MTRLNTWRYNPTSGDTPWIVGGAVAFFAGLWFLASRPARAAIVPPITLTPVPRPRPTPPPYDMVITPSEAGRPLVRQTRPGETTAAVRVLQIQLQDLGYAITHTDGRQSDELNAAVARYMATNGLPAGTTPVELMRNVDTEYGRVFAERGYV